MRILIYGHSGSGKTTLAKQLVKHYNISYFNGDDVRKMFEDYNFTIEGRKIQADRMKTLSNGTKSCIVDFICPLDHYRQYYDYTIFMNTIEQSKYKDTNLMFELGKPNLEIKNWKYNIKEIIDEINLL
mgnify:FL=1|jgi:adenylate kinase family enzyme|tara:strand:+ start:1728 stop:2111 length:384 start_codon:yes stop_codon:yes gene_type:complete